MDMQACPGNSNKLTALKARHSACFYHAYISLAAWHQFLECANYQAYITTHPPKLSPLRQSLIVMLQCGSPHIAVYLAVFHMERGKQHRECQAYFGVSVFMAEVFTHHIPEATYLVLQPEDVVIECVDLVFVKLLFLQALNCPCSRHWWKHTQTKV